MKNQMIMIINDRETLAKIATDPETELRIKTSIVDSVVNRVAEKCKNDLLKMAENKMNYVLKDMGLIEKISEYGSKISGAKLRSILEGEVRNMMETGINKIIRDEIEKQMARTKSYIEEKTTRWIEEHSISDNSIKAIMQESIDRYVEKRLQAHE